MRILINILISVSLLISTSGVYISMHFCKNNLVSVSFFSDSDKCCKGDCPFCKNVNHAYKVKTKVVPSEILNLNHLNTLVSLFHVSTGNIFIFNKIAEILPVRINPPPGNYFTPVYFSKLRL